MEVRRYSVGQIDPELLADVTELIVRANESRRDLFPGPRLQPTTLQEEYSHCEFLLLVEENFLVGAVAVAPREDWLRVFLLSVLPAWRRRGLGERLIEEARHVAAEQGLTGLSLDAVDDGGLTAYYHRLGFLEVSRRPYPTGQWNSTRPFDLVEMERTITSWSRDDEISG